MKFSRKSVRGTFPNMWARNCGSDLAQKPVEDERPLRAELFSADQMAQHGKALAGSHQVRLGRHRDRLLGRLAENESLLREVHGLLTQDVKADRRITPAGEWLLDNFHAIEEQIRTASRHLPKDYSRELPSLTKGPSAGLPRAYDIVLETISHADGRVDLESLSGFVEAYQSEIPLKLGELWAIPIMLRLALVENLRRVAVRIAHARTGRNSACHWADEMTKIGVEEPKNLILAIADMARSDPPTSSAFVAEITRRLHGKGPALAMPLTWIEQRLSESGQSIEQLVRLENQQQAADQVSMSNSIGSLRFMGAIDWREFVETMSIVEQTLREDPCGVYGKMDFPTRDHCRHVVERIAKLSSRAESEVASMAVQLALEGEARKSGDERVAHAGFYLIDEGLPQLERMAGVRSPPLDILLKASRRLPLPAYAGSALLLTAVFATGFFAKAYADGLQAWAYGLFGLLSLLCASHLALALTNWLATLLVSPKALPRMDFSKGIPHEFQTLAVVPSMLTNPYGIEKLTNALEVRFLANRDENLHFGLLTDFRDANEETLPEDEALLNLARRRIEELNAKHRNINNEPFFLFHRPRRWNPQDRIWMGYERKRGKLADLNRFLRSGSTERFSLVAGKLAVLSNVKYVITLDADTQLPRDSARQLVGAMAHPLNRPRYDASLRRVTAGYGILQPRVESSLSGANRSRYARMCASEIGIDPYTRAVSDVYQDLFQEGSFIGKGIYNVDAFELSLGGRFPENMILSHDLLEGCFARSGLLSDSQLYEDSPSSYGADANRRSRWIRGDWQIARWLLSKAPGPDARLQRNALSTLSRWKIFDNLRRSLTAAALTSLLLLGWTVLPSSWFWTLAVVGIILTPTLVASAVNLLRKPSDSTLEQHLSVSFRSLRQRLEQAAFTLVCLPYEAFFSLDAITRSVVRMYVTRRKLLQWETSDEFNRNGRAGFLGSCRTMWIAPALSIASLIAIVSSSPRSLAMAGPILCLWLASPAIAWWISQPLARRKERLTERQNLFLRKIARKTWAFFETFVGPEDHWLPPDNYQESPAGVIAHRTSPTNMGLALLANLSAYDFAYISGGQLLERTEKAFSSMNAMKRYKGHFFNWYDTKTLKPLPPLYISSVDSGNLAGHLMTLRPGLLGLSCGGLLGRRVFEGLRETLEILADASVAEDQACAPAWLSQIQKDMETAISSQPVSLIASRSCLERLAGSSATLLAVLEASASKSESSYWAHAFAKQCRASLDELAFLAPWIELLSSQDRLEAFPELCGTLSLLEAAELEGKLMPEFEDRLAAAAGSPEGLWLGELQRLVKTGSQRAKARIELAKSLASQCESLAKMEYGFLYDETRCLLAIGFSVSECRRDSSCYDLLASEARFSCFVAIAQGEAPQESWFAMGRLLAAVDGEPVLLSWSGSMFEYLMPLLVMPTYEHSLLDQTCRAAVAWQVEYGRKRGRPWGISESGYNAIDACQNYQYKAFGAPGLGLKRGLSDDLVVAPYASALALMVAPEKACLNLERLASEGLEGRYGLYEAIDYTPSRLPRGESQAVVRSFMAHHQGMSLLSLASLLLNRPMQRRFESDPLFQATLLLLQERIPRAMPSYARASELSEFHLASGAPRSPIRIFNSPNTPNPEAQLLSNGRYHVMLTNAGGGYSRWKDLAVTRWREDGACDNWGAFCYIRDVASGKFWSTAYQPTARRSKHFEAIFSEGRAEFNCREHDYDTHVDIAVSPEDDIELRRVRITNRARVRRTIDVTSYAEVVIAPPASDATHPAFSNLFVQTEIAPQQRAILCSRRPRSQNERTPWMLHMMAVHGAECENVSYETDRMRFIGRGNTVANPQAMGDEAASPSGALSGSEGSVLDPIVAIRCRLTLGPEESATVNIVYGVGESRDAALCLTEKYQDRHLADRVFDLAWTHCQVLLRQLNASEADAQLYGRLASSIIYANASLRAEQSVLIKNRRGQSGLWGYSISGDLPIALLQIEDPANIELARQLVQAHAYWRLKGLAVDLVIWNEDHVGYRQILHDRIMGLIAAGAEANVTDRPGGIFVRAADRIAEEDRVLIQTAARVVISDRRGLLSEQISGRALPEASAPPLIPTRSHRSEAPPTAPAPRTDLTFYNGLGGFTQDGREYVITTAPGQLTPAPWANVLANPQFGSVVSESGPAYTWSENSHEFRLTPWIGDPVNDSSGEAFYLRDEESGEFWSPTPSPCRGATPYITRHGFGYSVFEHAEKGVRSELWIYVAIDAAIKFSVLKIRNETSRPRRLSATGYAEWTLGDLRSKSLMHVVTEIDRNSGALLARNPYNTEFCERTAFFDVDDANRSASCDRIEFLGRNGSLRAPAAMTRASLSGKVGAALDPCAAIRESFDLDAGQEREIVFRLGAGRDADEARNLVNRFRGSSAAREAIDMVWQGWAHTLGAVNVETPDQSLNVLANGWLLYQTIACRLWARSGTYQSGGAFGFRDQLQDAMALVHARPQLAREHLLLCASRQFPEGDVQHWWHPPTGQGVRTHCSDDYLWLPLSTCRYVFATGDTGILDETSRFLQGRPLKADEDSSYERPGLSAETASLYEHCKLAILNGLRFGERGLPLMGSGDWNDGMNLVGEHGKGESVWLGFFLYETLMRFAELARLRGDMRFAERCENEAEGLRLNIERHGWDGEWYLRAYFDDGSPLGSSSNPECQIDSISQSWATLSGAGGSERSITALDSLYRRLVRREDALVQLLDTPFDKSPLNPGYIKGYIPGVRENGGQYTHAAVWAAMAFARLGDKRRAWEIFSIINPVNHASSAGKAAIYKVEPYVMAADVYAASGHAGQGGWTWYTGSAAWMYRLIVESLLGLRLEVDKLRFEPCVPADWEGFKIHYRYRETVYHITATQSHAGAEEMLVTVDGIEQCDKSIPLVDDHKEHWAELLLG